MIMIARSGLLKKEFKKHCKGSEKRKPLRKAKKKP